MIKINKDLLDALKITPAMYVDTPVFEYKDANGAAQVGTLRSAILTDINEVKKLDYTNLAVMRDWDENGSKLTLGDYIIRYTEI